MNWKVRTKKDRANAKLIAAAPELLQAAHWVMNMLDYKSDLGELTKDDIEVKQDLKAAIAKATD